MNAFLLMIILASSSAFAMCFNFEHGLGPSQIGRVHLAHGGQSYEAGKVCLSKTNRFGGGQYSSLEFKHRDGSVLLQAAVSEATGRCGANRYCKVLTGLSGNVLGRNLTSYEVSSIQIEINAFLNNAGYSGMFIDTFSKRQYLVTSAQ